jgi:catechol 2,3-dioxygenase-like lactoylglutathione lyase family enzyme
MAIVGVQEITIGVENPGTWKSFFEDFGLTLADPSSQQLRFVLPEGSEIIVKSSDDPTLPPAFLKTDGPREIIWGVDSAVALDQLKQVLQPDFAVTEDPDGTLHTVDPNGVRIGFRVFSRKSIVSDECNENTIGHPVRWNKQRKWYSRAYPKNIQHVVLGVPNIDAAVKFYTERLGFRVTDISRGFGVFMRCDGRHEHHNLFLPKAEEVYFHHISFGVDCIDELMAGANYMQRKSWPQGHGIGRHRISSFLFCYFKGPSLIGQIEYSADGDAIDDDWVACLWSPKFGNLHWVGNVSEAQMQYAEHDVTPLPRPIPSFSQLG